MPVIVVTNLVNLEMDIDFYRVLLTKLNTVCVHQGVHNNFVWLKPLYQMKKKWNCYEKTDKICLLNYWKRSIIYRLKQQIEWMNEHEWVNWFLN